MCVVKVKTFILGPIQTSCYLVSGSRSLSCKGSLQDGEGNPDAIIIDAGGDPTEMINYIREHNLNPRYLVNTHGHIDHILGNAQLKKEFPEMKICIHPADANMLKESRLNLSTELGFKFSSPHPDVLLNENDILALDTGSSRQSRDSLQEVKKSAPPFQFEIIHLPGHTKGGIGLLYKPVRAAPFSPRLRPSLALARRGGRVGAGGGEPRPCGRGESQGKILLFSGDAIFAGSIGRTDFPGSSHSELITNIKEKVFPLPDNTIIYPGHGPPTTVGDEKHSNPFF
ncbi:MAG: MBL fold metallo-hydrolase [Planctomycetota bacterium]|nr:MBL fold metallo-hydrolase [Planctomycetota bacterium]MDI6788566.1 MBL fold metallo-hydrolase [Planctomycetota bacterium]